MVFSSLAPNEDLGFEMFSVNYDLPQLIVARCDQCTAQYVNMAPQPVIPTWKHRTGVFLAFSGLSAVIYVAIVILQFLVLKTPYGY
jgi:hypothetical protein